MTSDDSNRLWSVPTLGLGHVDALRGRDLVIECFMHSQKERFARVKAGMGLGVDPEALERSISGAVRLAFAKTGGDFDAPTVATLRAAVDSLAQSAAVMGTPRDIIDHHSREIDKLLTNLEREEDS